MTSSAGVVRGSKTTKVRQASKDAIIWKAATMQMAREGTGAAIAARFAELAKRGDIRTKPEEIETDEDLDNQDAVDTEIDLRDDDASHLADMDRDAHEFRGMSLCPGQSFFDEEDQPEKFVDIEMRVTQGRCRLLRPPWMQAEPMSSFGEEFVDELGTRFAVLRAIGEWLEVKRKEFLEKPEPLALGVNALDELAEGLSSASPSAFIRLSGIGEKVTLFSVREGENAKNANDIESLFSRYLTGCDLVWTNGSLQLDFLFTLESRRAWVASAVIQWFNKNRKPIAKGDLKPYRNIAIPKAGYALSGLDGKAFSSLKPKELIQRANQMAGTRWSDVIDSYLTQYI